MRISAIVLLSAAALTLAHGATNDSASDSPPSNPSKRDVALDHLLSERGSAQALDSVIAEAKSCGIKEQAILEARFLYHVDRNEDEAIAAMLPDFIKQRALFKLEDSAIFSVKEDWLAVNEYVQAIAALKKGDKDAFKTHITEAFWLSPRQASAFAPQIERMRLEDSMRSVKIDFDSKFITLREGDAVSLSSLMQNKKAMIIQFWSPNSSECEASMPDYALTAQNLTGKGISMVSIIPDGIQQIITDARAMIQKLGLEPPGAWLIDQKENSLMRELRVQTMPVFVLISNEGKILFNGEPSDDELWKALNKIDSQIARPTMTNSSE